MAKLPKKAPDRTCNARTRSREGYCGLPAGWGTDHPGHGRCRLHGGATPRKHGLEARTYPPALMQRAQEILREGGESLLDAREEIALQKALAEDFARLYDLVPRVMDHLEAVAKEGHPQIGSHLSGLLESHEHLPAPTTNSSEPAVPSEERVLDVHADADFLEKKNSALTQEQAALLLEELPKVQELVAGALKISETRVQSIERYFRIQYGDKGAMSREEVMKVLDQVVEVARVTLCEKCLKRYAAAFRRIHAEVMADGIEASDGGK